jgi:hypothetical protein
VALDESSLDENLIVAGTDDGLIQISENGGDNWRKVENISGVAQNTYVNMVVTSQHDANVIYACFNHHKYGDFKPYVYMSRDRGNSWINISSNLPERGSSYALAEDHMDPNLLFVGTEFGVFFSNDGGSEWTQRKNGVPTIAVRDIAIQKRENDLVLGTFGRSFYVLDDYSFLRDLSSSVLENDAYLFSVREADLFEMNYPLGLRGRSMQGHSYYMGENLGSEAIFTYYLKNDLKSEFEVRKEMEKKRRSTGEDNYFPPYEQKVEEVKEHEPYLLFTIKDSDQNIIRKLTTEGKKGIRRLNWDLRFESAEIIEIQEDEEYNPWGTKDEGAKVAPGKYSVTMGKVVKGEYQQLTDPVFFDVVPVDDYAIPPTDRTAAVAFQNEVADLYKTLKAAESYVKDLEKELKYVEKAILRMPESQDELAGQLFDLRSRLTDIKLNLLKNEVAEKLDKGVPPTPLERIELIRGREKYTIIDPTETHKESLSITREESAPLLEELKTLATEDLKKLKDSLTEAGAPYTPHRLPLWE